ncbi:DUF5977 domain-containing protein [Terrimonas rubra]|uniref:DUF5977 domain-containing protein n=1 Tax=Terrimonas rubra TaxID=1035890 RepID=A0ABW6A4N6_9BACT
MKKQLFKFSLLGITLITGMVSIAQTLPHSFTQILPKSPDVNSISKYGDIPVGLFTGSAQYSYPLYTIGVGSFSHNISLNYVTNGVKVDDVASAIGVDWSISSGGAVSRTIRGLADNFYTQIRATTHNWLSASFWSFLRNTAAPADAQPDIFTYNAGGISGSFIYENGQVKELKLSGNKIIVGTNFSSFTIIDTKGNEYLFGDNQAKSWSNGWEQDEDKNGPYNKALTGWFLSRIITNVNDTIKFNYVNGNDIQYYSGVSHSFFPFYYSNRDVFSYQILDDDYTIPIGRIYSTSPSAPTFNQHIINYYLNAIEEPVLSTIEFKTGTIQFSYSAREDLPGGKKLDTVKVFNKNNVEIKKYALEHIYSVSNNPALGSPTQYNSTTNIQTQYSYLNKRLFLTGVKQIDTAGIVEPTLFEYETINDLPPRLSFSQDLFGYFNGKQNRMFFPNDTYLDDWYGGSRRYGGDRRSDFAFSKKGVLKKISYPTGGFTVLNYESNIVKQYQQDTIQMERKYTVNNTFRNDIWISDTLRGLSALDISILCRFHDPNTLPGGKDDEGVYIDLIRLSTNEKIINYNFIEVNNDKIYQLPLYYEDISPRIYPSEEYIIKVKSNTTGVSFTIDLKGVSLGPLEGKDRQTAGVRIASVENFSEVGKKVGTKRYRYQRLENPLLSSSDILMMNPQTYYVDIFRADISGGRYVTPKLLSSSLFDLYQSEFRGVVYSDVTELFDSAGTLGGTEHKFIVQLKQPAIALNNGNDFPLFFEWWHTPILIPGVPSSNTDYLNGKNSYTGVFKIENGVKKYIQKKFNYYSVDSRTFSVDTFYVARQQHPLTLFDQPYWAIYDVNRYMINHFLTLLDSVRVVNYAGVDSLSETVKYKYNNLTNFLQTETERRSSNGKTIKNFIRYPADMISASLDPNGIYANMVNKNMVDPVIEQYRNINELTTEKVRTTYAGFPSNLYLPEQVSVFNNITSGMDTRIWYNKYDKSGNLLSGINEKGLLVSYIWSYNGSYPVAEIKNMSYESIVTILGQTNLDVFREANNPDVKVFLTPLLSALPANADIVYYKYEPLVGITSSTDLRGRTTYYDYDSFKRLSIVRDDEGHIIRKVCYNYWGQATDCGPASSGGYYLSAEKSQRFTKNNCGSGYEGTRVWYIVPANKYMSTISQADADLQAQNDLLANGQNYANLMGTCEDK